MKIVVGLKASIDLASLVLMSDIGKVFLPKRPPVALPCDILGALACSDCRNNTLIKEWLILGPEVMGFVSVYLSMY